MKIRTALLSVSDKTGIVALAHKLSEMGVKILSSGGTHATIESGGIEAVRIEDYTGFPEMMDGRIKTLHPKVHGGILAIRDDDNHSQAAADYEIEFIDLVVVNLYPFEAVTAKQETTLADAVENIDIGGPSMVRSAAKNHKYVTILTDPADYDIVLREMAKRGGMVSEATRKRLAVKAFKKTARYDRAITDYFARAYNVREKDDTLALEYGAGEPLRYGENPHQKGAIHRALVPIRPSVPFAEMVGGETELSFTNYLDLDAALRIICEFEEPTVAILKHLNPCGLASDSKVSTAFRRAYKADPMSAFGSVVAVNRPLKDPLAIAMTEPGKYIHAILAPAFTERGIAVLHKKKWGRNCRLLAVGDLAGKKYPKEADYRHIAGGMLAQDANRRLVDKKSVRHVTKRAPTDAEWDELKFAWKVVKHVKSNSVVITKNKSLVGLGVGQVSRVDAVKLAVAKAGKNAAGCVLASDAFFPFPDNVEEAHKAGITAIIQPGGSMKDDESIAACDEAGMAMAFTGMRHFIH